MNGQLDFNEEKMLMDSITKDMRATLKKAREMEKFHLEIAKSVNEMSETARTLSLQVDDKTQAEEVKVDTAVCVRLPMLFEQKEAGETDIDWPKYDELTESLEGEPVYIETVETWTDQFLNLSGIRITLSNGQQSPYFHPEKAAQRNHEVHHIDPTTRVKKITLEGGLRQSAYCSGIIFEDAAGKELLKWKSRPDFFSQSQLVPDREVLVGIYGRINHKFSGIQNFGFITAQYSKTQETVLIEVEEASSEAKEPEEAEPLEVTEKLKSALKTTETQETQKDVSFAGSDGENSVDLTSESLCNHKQ